MLPTPPLIQHFALSENLVLMSGQKGRGRWGVPENLIAAPRRLETGYAWIVNPPTGYVRDP